LLLQLRAETVRPSNCDSFSVFRESGNYSKRNLFLVFVLVLDRLGFKHLGLSFLGLADLRPCLAGLGKALAGFGLAFLGLAIPRPCLSPLGHGLCFALSEYFVPWSFISWS